MKALLIAPATCVSALVIFAIIYALGMREYGYCWHFRPHPGFYKCGDIT